MADDTGPLCNSDKNHLQLALEQPTKYGDDIEAGGTFPDTDEDHFEDGEKGSDEEPAAVEPDAKENNDSSKIPPLYQVEPGCTPLSCYSAIFTFIVMTCGIFWLLLISPPKNSVPLPVPDEMLAEGMPNYDFADSYDDALYSSTGPPIAPTSGDQGGGTSPATLLTPVPGLSGLDPLKISKHIVDDSGT